MTEKHSPSEYVEPTPGDTEPLMQDLDEARRVTRILPEAYYIAEDPGFNKVEEMNVKGTISGLPAVKVVTDTEDPIANVTRIEAETVRNDARGKRFWSAEVIDKGYADGASYQRGSVKVSGEKADGTKFEFTKDRSPKIATFVAGVATRDLIRRAKKH